LISGLYFWTERRMGMDDIEQAKAALRDKARLQRAAIPADVRAEAGASVAAHFLAAFALDPDRIIAAYWPIRDELDCRPLIVHLMDHGQKVCLPVTEGDAPLVMRLWIDGEPLYPSGFGTLAPIETAPIVEPDIVLVPLLAFDRTGTRLGYGKGHYDRTIARMASPPLLVGLAFAGQEVAQLPRADHDVPLAAIVTERGVTRFENAA
jgi:5-formyltetrahydrofolate cyclo-ligase